MIRRRHAFTLIELSVAVGIAFLVIALLYAFLSRVFSNDAPSVTRMTGASFIRQDARLAFEKLMGRLEEGIEVLSPSPGDTAAELEFKDVMNHHTALALDAQGQLITYRVDGGTRTAETASTDVATPGGTVSVARPVKVPGVKQVHFTSLSPTLVSIVLTVADGNQTGSLVATARLRNYRLVED